MVIIDSLDAWEDNQLFGAEPGIIQYYYVLLNLSPPCYIQENIQHFFKLHFSHNSLIFND